MLVLGIETSCDETAAAVLSSDKRILSNIVLSQIEEHQPYGGVVPEIAARSHLDHIDRIIKQAMTVAGVTFSELDGIAVTSGPGLIGGVIVGVMSAKAIAMAHNLPFIAINHLEGHALTARLTEDVSFPYLLLLVSGGHCQLLAVEGVGKYRLYGKTRDDAVGEAFDKSAKMLGIPYPGGPNLEIEALKGDPNRFPLPRPMKGKAHCDFSFSGLKTAVRLSAEKLPDGPFSAKDRADLSASFQSAAADVLADRCNNAIRQFRQENGEGHSLVVGGGVASNKHIRATLSNLCESHGMQFAAPPIHLCTDNAAMIAWAGLERLKLGLTDDFDTPARPRWPLESLNAESVKV